MAERCDDQRGHPGLWAYCHAGIQRCLSHPNAFITVAPAEWVFPIHNPLFYKWKHPDGHDHPRDLSDMTGPL
eukprot:6471652-Pyramimonas_sp.AAC.1